MLIDWVRSGRTGKMIGSRSERTDLAASVRPSWLWAKYFPIRPSHSVNKYTEYKLFSVFSTYNSYPARIKVL